MKIICIEEHGTDPEVSKFILPVLLDNAPYWSSYTGAGGKSLSEPRDAHRPSAIRMPEAMALGADLGEGRIRNMDAHGIQMQVVSLIAPVHLLPAQQAIPLARAANDRLAHAVAANPERLGGFAVLPWQDAGAATDELIRAVTELGFKGALILGRPGAAFLDHPRYFPVLAKFEELGVPLYLHPFYPDLQVFKVYYDGLSPSVSAKLALGGWGWHHEAGIHVVRLILSGIFEKLPNLKLISGHWGEMVPFFLSRLDVAMTREDTGLSRTITDIYRNNVWVTPAGMFDLAQFEFVHKVLGADRIIWSNDYPFLSLDGTREFLMSLPISDEDREKIAFRNAQALLRL
jgi:predicted TIM-barrel fold metal-dependent hydrolase